MLPSGPRLFDHSLADDDRAVILACAEGFGQECIHVRPLGRYGYTGARLFLARFDEKGAGAPYVIKLDLTEAIASEAAAMNQARRFFHDAIYYEYRPDPPNGKAALLYRLFGETDATITELKDVYTDVNRSREVCEILESVYDYCRVAHSTSDLKQTWGAAYEWYLRSSRPDRIETAFPTAGSYIDCMGRTYRNMTHTLEDLAAQSGVRAIGFVHGDLHPNNVVLSASKVPAIIDFAWAHTGDILQDFVLMECSFRFLLFPRNIDWQQHHQVTVDMTRVDGPEIVQERYTAGADLAQTERYLAMANAVRSVRTKAKATLGTRFDFDDYLKAQYMVLYGLSKLETYPFYESVDALGVISQRLLDDGA